MRTLATNSNNDIFIDSTGNLAIAEGKEAIANVATNKTRVLYGEIPLNTEAGIPFFDVVFQRLDVDLFRQFLYQELEDITGVSKVADFSYSVENGVFKYSVTIETTNAEEIEING